MLAFESAIAVFEGGPAQLRSACVGLSQAQLNTRTGPGTWSIQDVLVHLLDSDLASTHRMRRMVAENNPLLVSYDEDLFIARLPSGATDTAEVLALFEANRTFTARWLRTLSHDDLARTGIHTQRGRVTVLQLVEIYSHHVTHHMGFVDGKRKALGC